MDLSAPEIISGESANHRRQAGASGCAVPSLSEKTEGSVKERQDRLFLQTFVENGRQCDAATARLMTAEDAEVVTTVAIDSTRQMLDALQQVALPSIVVDMLRMVPGQIGKFLMVRSEVSMFCYFRCSGRDYYREKSRKDGEIIFSSDRGSYFTVEEFSRADCRGALQQFLQGGRLLISNGLVPLVTFKSEMTDFDEYMCEFMQLVPVFEVVINGRFVELDFFWLDPHHVILRGGILCKYRNRMPLYSSSTFPYPHEEDYTEECCDCGRIHENPWEETREVVLTNEMMKIASGHEVDLRKAPSHSRYGDEFVFRNCHPIVKLYEDLIRRSPNATGVVESFLIFENDDGAIFSSEVGEVQGNNVIMGNTSSCAVCATNFADGVCRCGMSRRVSVGSVESVDELVKLRIRWNPDDTMIHHDDKYGAKWNLEYVSTSNGKILGFFSYFSFGEVLPLILLAKQDKKVVFGKYLEHLLSKSSKRMRIRNIERELYMFLRVDPSFEKYLLAPGFVNEIEHSKVLAFVGALESIFSSLAVPHEVVMVQGPPMLPAFAPISRVKRLMAMQEFEGLPMDGAYKRSAMLESSLPTKYGVDAANEMLSFFKERCILSVQKLGETIIALDAIYYFFRHRDYIRMFAQLLLLFTKHDSLYESARTIYNSSVRSVGLKEWVANANRDLFTIAELEEEQESDVDSVQGPNMILHSAIWRKLAALVAASTVPEFLWMVPGFMRKAILGFEAITLAAGSHASFGHALVSFGRTFVERVSVFMETWDYRDLLAEHDHDSLIVRGGQLLTMSVVNNTGNGLYFPSPILAVEACEKWLKECDDIRHCSLSMVSKKVPPALDHIYAKVLQKRNGLDAAIKSSRPRDKEPMSYWFAGFPGTGKTEMVNDVNRFVVQFDERRAVGEDGLRQVLVNDVGTVSFDQKYWLGVVDPTVIHFNDMKGSGYVNNGNAVVVPDILRMAVDICPFPTPQASLEAKDNSYIDPDVAVVSSNDAYYQFSIFGNNWKKLTRRYRKVYFFAFPQEYHVSDDDHLNQYAGSFPPLKSEYDELTIKDVDLNRMRYYSCSWSTDQVQNVGDLALIIRKKVAVGYHNFLKIVKQDYLENLKLEKRAVDKKGVCVRWTPFEAHDGENPCMDGCDILERLRPKVAMIDSKDHSDLVLGVEQPQELQGPVCSKTTTVIEGVADRVIDAGIARSEARLRKRFDMFKSWIYHYRFHAAGLVSGLVAAGIVYSLIRSERSEVETFSSSAVTPIQGSVVNPTTLDTDSALMQRYGMQEAKAREMEQPPQYPVNERVHVFLSASSKTSAFDDINRLAVTNWRKFRGSTGEEGYGLFLDSTTLYMQSHVFKALKGPLTLLPPPGYSEDSNFMRLVVDCSRAVCENDDTLIRIPPFPVSSIWKHIADNTGALASVSVGGSASVLAKKTVVDLRPFHIEGANQVFKYPISLQKGDCGTPVVANVNGSGIILGVHLVKFKDGESGCSIFNVNQLKRLAALLPGRCLDMHFEKIAEVQGLSSVSKFRSARGVSMEVLGTFEKCNKQAKSDIRPTRLNPIAVANLSKPMVIPDLPTHGVRIGETWYSPSVHKFKGMALPYKWSRSELERAARDYLDGMPIAKLAPIPISQQLNGVEGDPLIKGMNLKTSAGVYQRFYPDKSFLMSRVEMNIEFKDRVSRVMATAADTIRVEHQKWCLKDELIALEKALVSKFRFFMASDPENLFLSRCFGGPIVAHMYEHKEFFEAYGAFNPASPEFGKLMDRHRKFANLLMADLKHMDSSHRSFMSEAVADVFREIAKRCGYNDDAANALWNLVASAVLSLIELSGDLAYCNEGMGSGIFFTFIFNCVVLSLMYRVAWFRISDEAFRKHNALTCGGDDSACTTDNTSFTGTYLKEVFSEYGYELTPPTAKDGKMAEFFPWDEFVFLKRSPITLVVMGKKVEVGALAKDSIWKSLGWDIPSKDVSHEDRMAQVLDAGQREMALHGREAFDDFQKQVGSTYYYRKLSYEEILAKYVAGKFYDDILNAKCDNSSQVESICSGAKGNFGTADRDHSTSQAKITSGEAVVSKIGEAASSVPLFSGLSENLAAPFPNRWRTNGRDTNANNITDYFNNKTQSVVSNEITTFNLVAGFSSGAVPEKYPADFANPMGAISIGSILERPVSIGSFTWDSATAFSVSATNILANWRANPTVTAYLRNYKKFRGRPILRIVSTGNPRWYGKLVVSCDIRPGNDGYSRGLDMAIPSTDLGHVSQVLQMPHISIDASAPAMYEVEFPWVAPSGWYDQHQTSRQPAYNLVVAPCCALSSSDGVAVGALEYEVYVYLKDLELAVPCALAVQGPGKGDSELAEGGSLSSKLTAGSSFAAAATMVPQLAPFAAPMSMALGAAAGVAKSMGYSAPPILETTAPTLDKVTPSLSLMTGRTHVERLVADPKQGVSITADAAGCGNNGDMEIGNIIKRPGLIAQLSWSPSTGTITNNTIPVGVSNNFSSGGWTYRSPLGYVAQAFRYWTGSIKFRVEVVASPYHRGSFVVMYVPHDSFSFPNVNTIFNEFQNWVIDLSGSRVVEFTIPYTKEEPYTEFANINGNLYVLQLNALQNMGGTNAITINVYHSAGDDMDFQRPCQAYGNIGCIALDSLQGPGEGGEAIDNFGNEETEIVGGGTSAIVASTAPSRTLIYWGESFSNLKEICSRAQPFYVGSLPWPAANSQTVMYRMWHTLRPTCAQLKRVPAVAGTYGPKNAAMLTVGSAYFEPMFLAVRGGYRFGFNRRFYGTIPDANAVRVASVANCSTVSVNLGSTAYSTYQMDGSVAAAAITYSNNADRLLVLEEGAGVFIDSVQNHPLVYYEVPYTSKFRFRNSRKLLNWMLQSTTGSEEGCTLTMFPLSPFAAEQFVLYASVADDWSVHCFYCVPRTRSPVNPLS